MLLQEGLQGRFRPAPAGNRDVRMVGAALGFEADPLACPVDLGGECGERPPGGNPRPERAAAALGEAADAVHLDLERLEADAGQCRRQIFRGVAVDLTDEAECAVQLLLILPAQALHPADRVDQQVADRLGRPEGEKEAVAQGSTFA